MLAGEARRRRRPRPMADERTASGPPSGLTNLAISLIAERSPAATASTIAPESATPGRDRQTIADGLPKPDRLRAEERLFDAPSRAGQPASREAP